MEALFFALCPATRVLQSLLGALAHWLLKGRNKTTWRKTFVVQETIGDTPMKWASSPQPPLFVRALPCWPDPCAIGFPLLHSRPAMPCITQPLHMFTTEPPNQRISPKNFALKTSSFICHCAPGSDLPVCEVMPGSVSHSNACWWGQAAIWGTTNFQWLFDSSSI